MVRPRASAPPPPAAAPAATAAEAAAAAAAAAAERLARCRLGAPLQCKPSGRTQHSASASAAKVPGNHPPPPSARERDGVAASPWGQLPAWSAPADLLPREIDIALSDCAPTVERGRVSARPEHPSPAPSSSLACFLFGSVSRARAKIVAVPLPLPVESAGRLVVSARSIPVPTHAPGSTFAMRVVAS